MWDVLKSSLHLQGASLFFSVMFNRKFQATHQKSTIIKLQRHVGWLEAGQCGVQRMEQSPHSAFPTIDYDIYNDILI